MTRHALTAKFDNHDVVLDKGDLVIILENERCGERGFVSGDRQHCLERVGGNHHVMVRTRHGRKVRVPRHILSEEIVMFNCQLCSYPPISTYRDYVAHMIDKHLRVQLLKGLDMTKKRLTCPFPSCQGVAWPSEDNLLFHYASHHNVLEKVIMYETEAAADELRAVVKEKENTIEGLKEEISNIKNSLSEKTEGLGGEIQDIREMKIITDQELPLIMNSLKDEHNYAKRFNASKSSQTCGNVIFDEVKKLSTKNETLQKQNDSFQLEIKSMEMQNGNLSKIIEVGKSTIDTAKKLSKELEGENKELKERETKFINDLYKMEFKVNKLKVENKKLNSKYKESRSRHTSKAHVSSVYDLQGQKETKSPNLNQSNKRDSPSPAAKEDRKLADNYQKLAKELELIVSMNEDLKVKLRKCKENYRNVEESKKCLDRDFKALIVENRNSSNEIKALKNNLTNCNKAIFAERANSNNELINLRAELAVKNAEVEKSSTKLRIVSSELKSVLNELKQSEDIQVSMENEAIMLKEKLKGMSVPMKENVNIPKLIEDEQIAIKAENKKLKDSNQELKDRVDLYVRQCAEWEKKGIQLQHEISLLKSSIENLIKDHSSKVQELDNTLRSMNDTLTFYRDQEEVLIDENEKLKDQVITLNAEVVKGNNVTDDLIAKYNVKCDMFEELQKIHEKSLAQLRRKNWEIHTYQKKLDSAFESEYHSFSREIQAFAVPGEIGPETPVEVGSSIVALDLSVKDETISRELNNNEFKKGELAVAGPSGVSGSRAKRRFSECSSYDDSNPDSRHENLDASFDSTSTCPSEAAALTAYNVTRLALARKRSKSVGMVSPQEDTRLEHD